MSLRTTLYVCLITVLSATMLAQTPTGQISGSVNDNDGSALPGVTVTATNRDTGVSRNTVANAEGLYVLPLLPSGLYEVTGELSGFQTFRRPNVVVNVGSDVTVPIRMRVGVAETITVSAEAPVVETTRSSVASTVTESMIENLPVNGRNFIDFALTTPGVTRDSRFGDISFGGLRGTLNSLVVDGADNNNTFFGQSLGRTGDRNAYQFSQDAVKEFQVNTNGYTAEYGRAGGAVINVVTKSGTNNFDGSAFWFYRDRDLRAKDYIEEINNRRKGAYGWDQFGASLGGPIVPDRHHFFLSYDGQRNELPVTVLMNLPASTPSDAATLAAIERLRPLTFDYFQGRDQDIFLIKTDHEIAGSHLSARLNLLEFVGKSNESTTGVFEHSGDSLRNVDTLSANLTTPISNSLFNEVRAQYAKDEEPGTANSASPEAVIRQGGVTVLTIGRNNFSPRETTIKRYQIADTATWIVGNHTLKGGFDLNNDEIFNFFPGLFSGVYTFQSLASFQNGRPTGSGEQYVQAFPGAGTSGPITNPDQMEWALFVQDEWQLNNSLTVNAGLRYDLQDITQPEVRNPDSQLAAAGIDTSSIPQDTDNLAPRLGLSWVPSWNQRAVFRAGYGLFYGRTPAIMVSTAHSQNGISVSTVTFRGESVPTYPNAFTSMPAGAAAALPSIFVFDDDYENPEVHQASVGYEQALTDTIALGVSYLLVRGNNLSRSADINVGPLVTENVNLSTGGTVPVQRFSTTRPFTNFSRVIQFQSTADSEYNGITVDLNKRFGNNWQARLAYTWADTRDNKPDATAVVTGVDDSKYAWYSNQPELEWGVSDNHVEHRAVLSGVWNLDYWDDREDWWSKLLIRGWGLSGILSWQTGFPFSPKVGADLNRDLNSANDRAPGFDRNSFTTDDFLSIDPRITKAIPLAGDVRLQLIAEAFNITNEPNITGVQVNYYSYNATTNTLTPISNFNAPTSVTGAAGTGPRTLQLAARLTF